MLGIGTFLKNLAARVWRAVKPLFKIVAEGVADDILSVVNDPDLQALALEACRSAWRAGLTGDAAWRHAFDALASGLSARGRVIAMDLAETVLQAVYSVWKAGGWK